jgi:hypothetical protein
VLSGLLLQCVHGATHQLPPYLHVYKPHILTKNLTSKMAVPWLRQLFTGLTVEAQIRTWVSPCEDFWLTNWHWDRSSSEFFSFPVRIIPLRLSVFREGLTTST